MAESTSEQNVDRISSLPDEVLYHILSFLPTRTSVTTSLLSRRWRHIWEHLQVLNFHDANRGRLDHDGNLFRQLAVFVNAVLALRSARDVRIFRLSTRYVHDDSFIANSVDTWIRTAIGPHLEELNLRLCVPTGCDFVLPRSLFGCTKLESLRLFGGIHVKPPSTVCLSSLKMLHLDIDYVDSINLLLSGCPVLQTLYLSCGQEDIDKIHVPATLKKLKFEAKRIRAESNLEIYAPRLEYLSITQITRGLPFSVGNFHNMVEAYLDVYSEDEPANSLLMLLRAICRTKTLVLRRLTIKWLLRAPTLELPEFHRLVCLELFLPRFNSGFLMTMLQQCNMLQILIIRNEKDPTVIQNWPQPEGVFDFLVSHLNCFKFLGYQGYEDELAFVGYILQNGLSLETVIIHTDVSFDIEKKYNILKELSAIPRGSNLCQLSFH